MPTARPKRKTNLCTTVTVVAVAFVLLFNFTKPPFGNFSHVVDTHHLHEHDHDVAPEPSAFHGDHPAHKHEHEHRDGTTHEHEYHDGHCAKINSTMVWPSPITSLMPPAVYFLATSCFAMKPLVVNAHLGELLRPPILA